MGQSAQHAPITANRVFSAESLRNFSCSGRSVQIVGGLQVHPELRRCAEVSGN